MVFIPEIFRRLNISQDWSMVLFAAGAVHGLSQGTSMGEGIARKVRDRHLPGSTALQETQGTTPPLGVRPLLEVEDLTVKYGQIVALDSVSLTVPENTVMGLIGPNGAGKSTLTDALTGFIADATGTITLDGRRLTGLPVHRRASGGLRRTFQQDRVPVGLTVGAYLRFAAHRGTVGRAELAEICEFLGCPPPSAHVSQLDVGSRRLLEVAAALLARPKVLILDEPAAGLAHAESMALAARLTEVPARYGASVLLIEHDLDMVRRACATVVVLNFGEVIASGPPAQVLADPEVARAYLGDEMALA
jgi:branched-chain amino acid transport system permease protein